jgi:hypothetical protein
LTPALVERFDDRFLLTVHGVTSDNSGLARLRSRCEESLPGLVSDSYFYGSVIPFRDLTEATSWFIFRAVREKLELVYLKYIADTGRRLFVVAHSFGTLAVIRALEMHVPGLSIEGLVLLGSIVPQYHLWDGLMQTGQLLNPPLAIIRPFDRVVRHGRWVGGGESGALGFIANGMTRPLETYKLGGHTAYFPNDNGDVITMLRAGVGAVELMSYENWKTKLSFFQKLRL